MKAEGHSDSGQEGGEFAAGSDDLSSISKTQT